MELHFRHSLGLVAYHAGDLVLSHEDYMWSAVGRRWGTEYPGFSTKQLDAFRQLLDDLKHHCVDFLSASEADFAAHVEREAALKMKMLVLHEGKLFVGFLCR